jgi:hypothetical protein
MSGKCAVCDQKIATIYDPYTEDYYCEMCHAEQFYRADFDEGYQMAEDEIASGDIDARAAVYSFEQDPPDCARHWGYLQACIHEMDNEIVRLYEHD